MPTRARPATPAQALLAGGRDPIRLVTTLAVYAHDGSAYLVEVKSHLKASDVLAFHKKAEFAAARLGRPVTKLIIALSMERGVAALMHQLGIRHRVRAVVDVDVA